MSVFLYDGRHNATSKAIFPTAKIINARLACSSIVMIFRYSSTSGILLMSDAGGCHDVCFRQQ